ncbi:MAG: hypothetical protein GX892_01060 [Thermoanaerobacteraceae bacterium]|jgi:hypothetical protein|nr:hypothetical protein [Thermoanaerobacteraceae bacterium]HHY04681.1 hypothetical protein [Thermoanaerobacterales bacterium]
MYKHFIELTDKTGIIQFSKGSRPDIKSGYTIDDNARALIIALGMKGNSRIELAKTYSRYMKEAQLENGVWQNLKINGKFSSALNSEDSMGRGVLAASFATNCEIDEVRHLAKIMLQKSIPSAVHLTSPRASSYVLLCLCNLLQVYNNANNTHISQYARKISQRLINLYEQNHTQDWHWYENILTYCNALMPHALFAYYIVSSNKKALQVAVDSLNFLTDTLFKPGYLSIVGNRGWWKKGQKIPPFDQQPVDACSIALACIQGYIATQKSELCEMAKLAYEWYLGKNINKVSVINEKTQGCHDALTPYGVNLNQGAEAIISYLMAHQIIYNDGAKSKTIIPTV